MKERDIPIENVEGFWYADSHIEEYSEEPTNLEMIWDLLKSLFKELVSKLRVG